MSDDRACDHCKVSYGNSGRQFWHIANYHGIRGYFCSHCFDLIEHWQDEPKNPEKYQQMKLLYPN